ncbi:MAG: DIP1984 family protein [Prevotella sp.]|nr:DIP1984 family protein [Prevotella sp.]
MKLAEALSIRKDLQRKIAQLQSRVQNNVKVQEGESPAENPDELLKELDSCLNQLEDLVFRINKTNMHTLAEDGTTLTQMMARKDVLTSRIGVLRAVFDSASASHDRYSRSEIKQVTIVDVKALGQQIDRLSARLRTLDIGIQSLNFATELE